MNKFPFYNFSRKAKLKQLERAKQAKRAAAEQERQLTIAIKRDWSEGFVRVIDYLKFQENEEAIVIGALIKCRNIIDAKNTDAINECLKYYNHYVSSPHQYKYVSAPQTN